MAKKNLINVTLNVSATAEQLKTLNAFMDTMGIGYESSELRTDATPKAETKAETSKESKDAPKETAKGKAAKTPKVYKVDKNGNQWIIDEKDFNMADYRAKGKEMYGYEKLTSRKYRENVYRALGYIL